MINYGSALFGASVRCRLLAILISVFGLISNAWAQNFIFDSFVTHNGGNYGKITASSNQGSVTVKLGDATSTDAKKGAYGTFDNSNAFLNDGTTIYTSGGDTGDSAIKFVTANRWLDIEIVNSGSTAVYFDVFALDCRNPGANSATSYRLSSINANHSVSEFNSELFVSNLPIGSHNNLEHAVNVPVPANQSRFFRLEFLGAAGAYAQTQIDNLLIGVVTDRYRSYDAWVESYFSEDEVDDLRLTGLDADPDGDDLPNKFEYTFGHSPLAKDTAWYSDIEVSEAGMTLKYNASPGAINQVAYLVEASNDLNAASWSIVSETRIQEGSLTAPSEMEASFDGSGGKGFLRLNNLKVRSQSVKKGIAFGYALKSQWGSIFEALQPAWHYSWGRALDTTHPDWLEFVPQFWGKNSVSLSEVQLLKPHILSGKVKYLIGFNEPDLASQANMTVSEAITKWQLLESYLEQEDLLDKVGLISPVVAHNYDWLDAFLLEANNLGLKVDYVGLHLYTSGAMNTPDKFITRLSEIYQTHVLPYNKKIWLKEFSVRDGNAVVSGTNVYSPEYVSAFMSQVLPFLEVTDWVYRYAWFSNVVGGDNYLMQESSVLFDTDAGTITNLGELYSRILSWQ